MTGATGRDRGPGARAPKACVATERLNPLSGKQRQHGRVAVKPVMAELSVGVKAGERDVAQNVANQFHLPVFGTEQGRTAGNAGYQNTGFRTKRMRIPARR